MIILTTNIKVKCQGLESTRSNIKKKKNNMSNNSRKSCKSINTYIYLWVLKRWKPINSNISISDGICKRKVKKRENLKGNSLKNKINSSKPNYGKDSVIKELGNKEYNSFQFKMKLKLNYKKLKSMERL